MFLDRDGTLNVDVGYLHALDQLELFPWTLDALRLLKRAGFVLVVVSNQSGLALGLIEDGFVEQAHAALQQRAEAAGAGLDGYYYCPHHPRGSVARFSVECRCRKPGPELIERATADLQLDPSRSYVIGDKWLDVQLGHAVGARSILVRTGWGRESERRRPDGQRVDAICDNLMHAVAWILDHSAVDGAPSLPAA